jgi:hypothetical protein
MNFLYVLEAPYFIPRFCLILGSARALINFALSEAFAKEVGLSDSP